MFEQAARGMYAVAGAQVVWRERRAKTLKLRAPDMESLLVQFLTELLWLLEEQHLAFDEFTLRIGGTSLRGTVHGAAVDNFDRPIKAVTFHGLEICEAGSGLAAQIVFDI